MCELRRKIVKKTFLPSFVELWRRVTHPTQMWSEHGYCACVTCRPSPSNNQPMHHISGNFRCLARLFGVMAFALCFHTSSFAQTNRIIGNINTLQWTPLPGHVKADARSEYDQSKAPDSLRMPSVTLVLKPSADQQAALDQLLLDQQNPKSSSYHRWLTPEEYADRFGVSKSDLAKIADWAQSQGLTVTGTARARNAVSLSGSAAQIESAFHTEIHLYKVNGESHYANATNPSVPAAMSKLVSAIRGLNDFRMKPQLQKAAGITPAYTS